MSRAKTLVGEFEMEWRHPPKGPAGHCWVEVKSPDGKKKLEEVSWRLDHNGLWVEFEDRVSGFDIQVRKDDDGRLVHDIQQRISGHAWRGIAYRRPGEDVAASGLAHQKRGAKIKSQMSGKILKISVNEGDAVKRGESLCIMEAMKMENEIVSPQDGRVKSVSVKEGQSVETGTLLFQLEAE